MGAGFGERKHPFVIRHLKTSEATSALPYLPVPSRGLGYWQFVGGEGPRKSSPAAFLALGGELTPWGSLKGDGECLPCHPHKSTTDSIVPTGLQVAKMSWKRGGI